MNTSLPPFAPENLVSRDRFGRPDSILRLNLMLTLGIFPISAATPIFLYRHTSSGQSRVYRVTHLLTNGVQCGESAGTGPVVLKVVPVTGAAFAGHHGPSNVRLSFPTPTIAMTDEVGMLDPSEARYVVSVKYISRHLPPRYYAIGESK